MRTHLTIMWTIVLGMVGSIMGGVLFKVATFAPRGVGVVRNKMFALPSGERP